jgi:hypothetical protein
MGDKFEGFSQQSCSDYLLFTKGARMRVTDFLGVIHNISANQLAALTPTGRPESLAAAKTLKARDSGRMYSLNLVGGFAVTLPPVAEKWKFKFVAGIAPTTAYTVITNASENVIHGQITTGEDAAGSVATVPEADTISFVANLAIIGDWCEVESDGTNIYVSGMCAVQDGMTTTQVS